MFILSKIKEFKCHIEKLNGLMTNYWRTLWFGLEFKSWCIFWSFVKLYYEFGYKLLIKLPSLLEKKQKELSKSLNSLKCGNIRDESVLQKIIDIENSLFKI